MTLRLVLLRAGSGIAILAIALWLGGIIALGALAAPAVFSIVPLPASADAMTVVFRRFDGLAMACAAILLAVEASGVAGRRPRAAVDWARAGASALAAALATYEGLVISPRIAALHAAGALRGLGAAGAELARWHAAAEACGEAELALLALLVALYVISLTSAGGSGAPEKVHRRGERDMS